MERKDIIDRARALFLQVKHNGNPEGVRFIGEEFEFQENGEDLSIVVGVRTAYTLRRSHICQRGT